jgi:predicted nuclease of predicted toxin-antitoxin system
MKLLFDENLSPRLVKLLVDGFPGSVHVRDVGLKAASDHDVWTYARENGFVICSKDSDMHQRSFVFGFPPKIIWVRLGNCSTDDVATVLRNNIIAIDAFYADDYASFLSLSWS